MTTTTAILSALRATPGVRGCSLHKGWIVVQATDDSRALALAALSREAGFTVRHKGVLVALR